MEHPEYFELISGKPSKEKVYAFYVMNVFCNTHDMHERGTMKGKDWEGNLGWMKMAFKHETVRKYWENDEEFRLSYDEDFRNFVDDVLSKE